MIKPDFAKPSLDTISSFCKSFNVGADESSLYSLHTLIYSVHFFSSYFISVVSLSTPNFLLCKAIISSGVAGGVFPSPLIYTVSLKSPSRYLKIESAWMTLTAKTKRSAFASTLLNIYWTLACGNICLSLIVAIRFFVLSISSKLIPKASPSFETPTNITPPFPFAYPTIVLAHLIGLSGFKTVLYS